MERAILVNRRYVLIDKNTDAKVSKIAFQQFKKIGLKNKQIFFSEENKSENEFSLIEKKFTYIEKNQKSLSRKLEMIKKHMESYMDAPNLLAFKCEKRLQEFEDTLMHLYHNIKKNQFLYSHYPDEWAKNYSEIKKGIKNENVFMQKIEGEND